MAWTLCTSGSAISKAGADVNSDITASGSTLAAWSDEAESIICDIARVDVVTNYGSLISNGKKILDSIASDMIGQRIIGYDPDAIGITSATSRLNIIENSIRRNISLIENDRVKTYLGAT